LQSSTKKYLLVDIPMEDQKLISLIIHSLSFTGDEKTELIQNMKLFSSEDKTFLGNIFLHEQEEIEKTLTNHFAQEEKIIVQYLKKVLKLYDAEQLIHIKDRISDLMEKEHRDEDITAADKLLESL